jgi:hypothetical protein
MGWALLDSCISDRSHLLVAWVIDPALTEVGHVRAGHYSASSVVYLLARPPMPVRTTIGLQEGLELLRDVLSIYDTKRHTV